MEDLAPRYESCLVRVDKGWCHHHQTGGNSACKDFVVSIEKGDGAVVIDLLPILLLIDWTYPSLVEVRARGDPMTLDVIEDLFQDKDDVEDRAVCCHVCCLPFVKFLPEFGWDAIEARRLTSCRLRQC